MAGVAAGRWGSPLHHYDARGDSKQAQIAVFDLRTGERRTLLRGGSHAQYVAPGYLVYGVAGTLRAVAFNLARLETVGAPVPVVVGVAMTPQGGTDVSVADDGTLVYVPGQGEVQRTLVWVDRQGQEEVLPAPPAVLLRSATVPRWDEISSRSSTRARRRIFRFGTSRGRR